MGMLDVRWDNRVHRSCTMPCILGVVSVCVCVSMRIIEKSIHFISLRFVSFRFYSRLRSNFGMNSNIELFKLSWHLISLTAFENLVMQCKHKRTHKNTRFGCIHFLEIAFCGARAYAHTFSTLLDCGMKTNHSQNAFCSGRSHFLHHGRSFLIWFWGISMAKSATKVPYVCECECIWS